MRRTLLALMCGVGLLTMTTGCAALLVGGGAGGGYMYGKSHRACPHCQKQISTKATKCPYCESAVTPTE